MNKLEKNILGSLDDIFSKAISSVDDFSDWKTYANHLQNTLSSARPIIKSLMKSENEDDQQVLNESTLDNLTKPGRSTIK